MMLTQCVCIHGSHLQVLRNVLEEEDLIAAAGGGQLSFEQLKDRFTAELARHRKGIQVSL